MILIEAEKLIQFHVIWKLEWISLEKNQVFFCSLFQLLHTIPAPSLFLACQLQKLTISQLGNCPIQQNQTPQHPTCLTSQEIICQLKNIQSASYNVELVKIHYSPPNAISTVSLNFPLLTMIIQKEKRNYTLEGERKL